MSEEFIRSIFHLRESEMLGERYAGLPIGGLRISSFKVYLG
jgi:hypothetical protein